MKAFRKREFNRPSRPNWLEFSPYGLATISQKITTTEANAGTPSQNQIRE
jgi:hypothetical protein